ncbi:hypothetical protein [Aurantimonas sp. 22II-16-19i]|uniref:hypothetical protein n=1 Tax=Aurantimonas sp. 22II-16-19i TaxID=1317114 RepID=UPI0009F7D4D5|nr:hypothetical protein [Aurantimonas sp. 22II-16-19i]ORE97749.1 hypothetical protein ATO4_07415 [Aurantimonas sp. 22II-16-19i]
MPTAAFLPDAVRKVIERLPVQSTKDVKEMRRRGEANRLLDLIEACDAELAKRPIEYDGDTAAKMIEAEGVVENYDLASATRYAFSSSIRRRRTRGGSCPGSPPTPAAPMPMP